jgi:uncharacterized protein YcbK (DUF882 family)
MSPVHQRIGSTGPELTRRRFIKLSAAAAFSSVFPCTVFAAIPQPKLRERVISLYNPHSKESLETVYWAEGEYLPESLARINHIMRDHWTGEIKPVDTSLLDLMHAIHMKLKSRRPFHVLSGYRSPATNARLRRQMRGVAKGSLHMQAKAADIRLPGYRTSAVRRAAVSLKGGGVGYYPRSEFVHIDVGDIRYW